MVGWAVLPCCSDIIIQKIKQNIKPIDEINGALKKAANGSGWMGKILDYSDEPLVSTDFIGSSFSSTVDGLSTQVIGGNLVKIITWYDNEWGYSMRLADLAAFAAERLT